MFRRRVVRSQSLCRVCRERCLRSRARRLLQAPALAIAACSNEMMTTLSARPAGSKRAGRPRAWRSTWLS